MNEARAVGALSSRCSANWQHHRAMDAIRRVWSDGVAADGSSHEEIPRVCDDVVDHMYECLGFPKSVSIPAAVSAFPDEIHTAPRSWAERAYPRLTHDNRLDKGGHFAAWEQPQVFAAELRASFRSLR